MESNADFHHSDTRIPVFFIKLEWNVISAVPRLQIDVKTTRYGPCEPVKNPLGHACHVRGKPVTCGPRRTFRAISQPFHRLMVGVAFRQAGMVR
jgi:hypothetical protein